MQTPKRIIAALPVAALLFSLATPALAATVHPKAAAKVEARTEKVTAKADTAVTKRIADMGEIKTRVTAMKHLTDAQKATIIAALDADIATMQTLDAKIKADTDPATRKADIASVTKDNRIYALVIPQARITAAADRALTLADMMSALSTKLQTRIGEAQTVGKDISKMTAAVATMNTKIADAKVQAQAAIDGTINLTPDGGDKTKMEANTAALKAARTAVKTAEQDLKAAREAAKSVLGSVKGVGASAKVPVSASTEMKAQ